MIRTPIAITMAIITMRISTLKKSDVKRFYNRLADEKGLKPATIDNVHGIRSLRS